MKPRTQWYALRTSPDARPILSDTYTGAAYHADVDQAVYLVRVVNVRCVWKAQRIQPKHPLPPSAA